MLDEKHAARTAAVLDEVRTAAGVEDASFPRETAFSRLHEAVRLAAKHTAYSLLPAPKFRRAPARVAAGAAHSPASLAHVAGRVSHHRKPC